MRLVFCRVPVIAKGGAIVGLLPRLHGLPAWLETFRQAQALERPRGSAGKQALPQAWSVAKKLLDFRAGFDSVCAVAGSVGGGSSQETIMFLATVISAGCYYCMWSGFGVNKKLDSEGNTRMVFFGHFGMRAKRAL